MSQTLASIRVRNFKRFEQFTLHCRADNILVGPNNSGKSTFLDALRALYGAVRYARRLRPKLLQVAGDGQVCGYEIPLNSIPISLHNITRNYNSDDATIDFAHTNGSKLRLRFSPDKLPRLYLLDDDREPDSGQRFFQCFPIDIVVVPTLSPFEAEEGYINDNYLEQIRASRLASRHFRNIWYRANDGDFGTFSSLLEETWPGMSIFKPERHGPQSPLEMFYKEERRDREVGWAGFGFQVWLQILTHMLRGSENSVFVLDEPDIYLHPDLQRKLLRLVRERFGQYFLATHSTEIINEADIGDIVTVNSNFKSARRITSDDDYNALFGYIGSIENAEISKLSRARRVIFFEGEDKKLLKRFAARVGLRNFAADSDTIIISAGGFGRWRRVTEAAWTLKNVLQVDVAVFALFDRDYRDAREMDDVLSKVREHGISCRGWARKEIENYALVPTALVRLIQKRVLAKAKIELPDSEIMDLLLALTEGYRLEILGQMVSQTYTYEKSSGKDISTVTKAVSEGLEKTWKTLDGRFRVIPGKQFLTDLSGALQEKWATSITLPMLIEEIEGEEIDPEMRAVLEELDAFLTGRKTGPASELASVA